MTRINSNSHSLKQFSITARSDSLPAFNQLHLTSSVQVQETAIITKFVSAKRETCNHRITVSKTPENIEEINI